MLECVIKAHQVSLCNVYLSMWQCEFVFDRIGASCCFDFSFSTPFWTPAFLIKLWQVSLSHVSSLQPSMDQIARVFSFMLFLFGDIQICPADISGFLLPWEGLDVFGKCKPYLEILQMFKDPVLGNIHFTNVCQCVFGLSLNKKNPLFTSFAGSILKKMCAKTGSSGNQPLTDTPPRLLTHWLLLQPGSFCPLTPPHSHLVFVPFQRRGKSAKHQF